VNDTWGGKDFTAKFVEGETVGIGIDFSVPVARVEPGMRIALILRAFMRVFLFLLLTWVGCAR
jgi:hypothetical protein